MNLCEVWLIDLMVLFAVNDPAAIAAMLVAKEYGIKIPDDLAVVGFSNEPSSELNFSN